MIDVVDVVGPEHRQLPALLLDRRTAGAGLLACRRAVAPAAAAREDRAGESERLEQTIHGWIVGAPRAAATTIAAAP